MKQVQVAKVTVVQVHQSGLTQAVDFLPVAFHDILQILFIIYSASENLNKLNPSLGNTVGQLEHLTEAPVTSSRIWCQHHCLNSCLSRKDSNQTTVPWMCSVLENVVPKHKTMTLEVQPQPSRAQTLARPWVRAVQSSTGRTTSSLHSSWPHPETRIACRCFSTPEIFYDQEKKKIIDRTYIHMFWQFVQAFVIFEVCVCFLLYRILTGKKNIHYVCGITFDGF